jgi:acyl phosphate:glycerol-3-phosphate acyltransferase
VELAAHLIVAGLAYLLGSLPTGYLVARSRGLDIRAVGSGNIGATNVFRSLGTPAGIFVLVVDGLKGWLACVALAGWIHRLLSADPGLPTSESLGVVAGIAAVLGHNYTCWLRFRGGKGIATSAGVLAALVPYAFLIILGAWLATFLLSRFVSLASVTAALTLPPAVWGTGGSLTLILITGGLSALAVFRHRANLQRILAGTEPRFARPKRKP